MSAPFPKEETRQALREALPLNDQATASLSEHVAYTYISPSHARALDPENALVEGIRGAGKSFWFAALNSEAHRHYVAVVSPAARIGKNVFIAQGFGSQETLSKDALAKLIESYKARDIWRAVVASCLEFPLPFPLGEWGEKVRWVSENPERYDALLYEIDIALTRSEKIKLLLFDALDRLADDWPHIRPLARALLQVALDLRSCRSIRTKLFVRPDMIEEKEITSFPDSTKLTAKKVSLTWRRIDLYALLFQCLGNAPQAGATFREHCSTAFNVNWMYDQAIDVWALPGMLRINEELQKRIFDALAGPTMGGGPSGKKRGVPYTWLPNHLMDGREQVSPRSFFAALRHAVEQDSPGDWPYPLHYKALQNGVQEASRIRVEEITREDYPWVSDLVEPLRGKIVVPCSPEDVQAVWAKEHTIEKLRARTGAGDIVKLPPQHLEDGADGALVDLEDLGLLHRLRDGRIQMPDVYRIAFGLGRKGGVKPLR